MDDDRGLTGRRPTMRDVAARAGVSFKTVSRVVNAEAGVSPALAERVRAAVSELDFHPNAGARSLRRGDGRTSSIGLLLEDVSNPFSAAIQRAVEDEVVPRGVLVFSGSVDEDPARERQLVRAFLARRADGLLLVPASEDQSYLADDVAAGTPVVCVDRAPHRLDVDSVVTTNVTGAAEAVRHLAAHGHRRIGYLGDRARIRTAAERHRGFSEALATLRIPLDPALVLQDLPDAEAAEAATARLFALPEPPTALFTAQNVLTIGALRALRRLGLERAVALVGFDDFPTADLLSPGITVIAQDPAAMGRLAAELLLARIDGDARAPATHVVPTTLVCRGSGELPPPPSAGRAT